MLGTVGAASAGALLLEKGIEVLAERTQSTLLKNAAGLGPWVIIAIAALILVVSGMLFFIGTTWNKRRSARLGIFLAAFATSPVYGDDRVDHEISLFEEWARDTNPEVQLLQAVKVTVTDRDSMTRFRDRVENSLTQGRRLTPSGHDTTLRVSGRLDACFLLGTALRSTTGMAGPVWVVSDSATNYADGFTPVAVFRPDGEATDELQPTDHPADLPASELRETPAYLHDLEHKAVLPLMRFDDSEPVNALFCLNNGTWETCTHQARHGAVVLGFDSLNEPSPQGRVPSTLLDHPSTLEDPVLAITGMKGIGSTWDAYQRVLDRIVENAATAISAAHPGAPRFVTLVGPSALATALGARLGSPDATWVPLAFVKERGYAPSPLI
ncbi:hypothetical protein [Granulicoccus sp. GXG6511]|uniref:hypothetical protein n=1 Tax=Granulicoccus sp. GXG6511 TaxID=3381351 RepID=UPI003D7E50CB